MKICCYSIIDTYYSRILTKVIKSLGYDCFYTTNYKETFGSDITIALLFSYFMVDRSRDTFKQIYKKSGITAHIQCEQLFNRSEYLIGFLEQSKYCDVVLEFSTENFEKIKSLLSIPVILMPTGYHSDMTTVREKHRSPIESWDVFCLDNKIEYRDIIYKELLESNIKSTYGKGFSNQTQIGTYSYNSKICLNVNAYGPGCVCSEWKIIGLFMANSGFVILEKNNYPYLKDGEHWVMFDGINDLKEKVHYYLNHQKEREKIAESGFSYIVQNLKFETFVKKALDELLSLKLRGWC